MTNVQNTLKQVKSFCKTSGQKKSFDTLVRSFSAPKMPKDLDEATDAILSVLKRHGIDKNSEIFSAAKDRGFRNATSIDFLLAYGATDELIADLRSLKSKHHPLDIEDLVLVLVRTVAANPKVDILNRVYNYE